MNKKVLFFVEEQKSSSTKEKKRKQKKQSFHFEEWKLWKYLPDLIDKILLPSVMVCDKYIELG